MMIILHVRQTFEDASGLKISVIIPENASVNWFYCIRFLNVLRYSYINIIRTMITSL